MDLKRDIWLTLVATRLRCAVALDHSSVVGLILVAGWISLPGCNDNKTHVKHMNKKSTTDNVGVDFLWNCQSEEDLATFFTRHSLGGKVEIQSKGGHVFVQTYPYSGVWASHLYVFARESKTLRFSCFLYVRTQDAVDLKVSVDGAVTIMADKKKVATLEPEKATAVPNLPTP